VIEGVLRPAWAGVMLPVVARCGCCPGIGRYPTNGHGTSSLVAS
jgi:hypothetical protein